METFLLRMLGGAPPSSVVPRRRCQDEAAGACGGLVSGL